MIPNLTLSNRSAIGFGIYGAGDEARTRDIFLGKEVLYQLSYTRAFFPSEEGMMRESFSVSLD
jgi:hypothetical protein